MSQIRIMFTSVGRRVELMQAFRKAANELNADVLVYGGDIVNSAPALYFCDRPIIVPRIRDSRYIPELFRICKEEKINALIPTIDTDLLLLSKHKAEFSAIGTEVLIAAEDKVQLCRDKRFTADYFIKCGLKSPRPVDDFTKYDGGFPAFIKPKDGSSSINAFKVTNAEELKSFAQRIDDYIIQPFIEGTEYTIDCFCNFDGEPIFITPRERIAVRSGEILKGRIAQDTVMVEEMKRLLADFKPSGQITVQLIKQNGTGDNYYIEINPRFGGGAPMSMKAGADSAKACIQLLMGENLTFQPNAAKNDAIYSRFDQSVCVSESHSPIQIEKHSEILKFADDLDAVIFDLDDTLYSEKEYVHYGYTLVAERVAALDPKFADVEATVKFLWDAFESHKPAFDMWLPDDENLRKKCIEWYRAQQPEVLTLYPEAKNVIEQLRAQGKKVAVLTDGRPEGQWAKVKALNLANLVDCVVVTDELGGPEFRKPCDIAYRVVQKRLNVPFERMAYVGDNPKKDFVAPRELGMKSFWFKNPEGLY